MKEAQLETPKVQVLSFKYIGNYNMILQMQTQVNNQVKTMSSHINTKCENDTYHQNSGLGQHQHDALKLLPTPYATNGAWSELVTLVLTYVSSH